jgi:transcriptional regulator of acetoin/glycerol metabolism
MAVTAGETRSLRQAWAAFLDGSTSLPAARPEIVASWRRSRLSHVPVDHLSLPFTQDTIAGTKLLMAAEPVLEEFAASLADSPVSVLLADRTGRVVGRWSGKRSLERRLEAESINLGFVLAEEYAGTNGIGTALEMMRPVKIYGPEHYARSLHGLTCAAAPLRNPLSRQIEGVVNLACPNAEVNALLLPAVIDLARQIGREMHASSTHREQAVLEAFLLANRTTRGPIVAIGDDFLMANSAAAPLLDGDEQSALWQQVPDGLDEASVSGQIQTNRGALNAVFRGVIIGGRTVGSIIQLDAAQPIRRRKNDGPQEIPSDRMWTAGLVGSSQAWRHVCANALAARRDRPLIILGESGVGKFSLASFLHAELGSGDLHVAPAALEQVVGCRRWLQSVQQALTDPRIGTILITHVQNLTPGCVQTVSELISASRRGPRILATWTCEGSGTASALASHLNARTLTIPPLRERPADIRPIVEHLQRESASGSVTCRLSADALAALTRYKWPGNVRELCTVIRETLARRPGAVLTSVDLPAQLQHAGRAAMLSRIEIVERDAIRQALAEAGGNKSAAAIALGMSRKTLHRRIRRYRLDDNGAF